MATANHVLLRRITLTATTATVTFDSIPQTGYTDLKVVLTGRTTRANADPGSDVGITFNGSSTGYYRKSLNGDGSSAGSGSSSNIAYITSALVNSSYATANTFGNIEMYIPNYTSSSKKSVSIETVTESNASTAFMRMIAALWDNTAAISSISFTETNGESFLAGSSFSLYGIADVNTTPALAPKADGGDIIKTDGTYWYHAFLSSGSFKPQVSLTADVLVVAGGGGGGSGNNSGGGGAGGLLGFTSQALASTSTYACTVGAGGATGTPNGVNGTDSQFGSLTLVKGGGYGAGDPNVGATGGSGGGSSFNQTTNGGSATSGQGYAGGGGEGSGVNTNYYGGGGGGAGEAGNTDGIGMGGDGVSTYSSWGLITNTGQNISGTVYYAGGGGGSGQNSSPTRDGGDGGGGRGAGNAGAAVAGTAYTGGGGGGSGNSAGNTGKAGGSGVIIIRYPV